MATLETLELYWRQAAKPVPLLILGGGRWARVWAGVASRARGSGSRIAIVGRSSFDDLARWSAANAETGIAICSDPGKALLTLRDQGSEPSAIIASRPRDHRRDIEFCLENGIGALVEKPFLDDAIDAPWLLAAARDKGVSLGLGIEFSLLPALHFMGLRQLGSRGTLHWADPVGEERHGAAKRRHDEITPLEDILPHAASIFDSVWPSDAAIALSNLIPPNAGHHRWHLDLSRGDKFLALDVDVAASARKRLLCIEGEGGADRTTLDFTTSPECLYDGDRDVALPPRWRDMNSTLRLVLGAWFLHLAGGDPQPPIVAGLASHIGQHIELKRMLAALLQDQGAAR